jgi:LPXTG-motif cell wall-anchored protein
MAGVAFALIAGAGHAAADPGDDEEAPQPGPVRAAATCEHGTAGITVTLDYEDRALQVRLDRVSPDQASLTKITAPDEHDPEVQRVVFEPVPAGDYTVRVDRTPPDAVPVVVRPCGDPQPTDDLLKVSVECQAGWGLVTFTVTNPATKEVVEYTLTTGYVTPRKVPVRAGEFLEITENGIDDRTYTARLTGPGGTNVTKRYTVSCMRGNAPRLAATTTCPDKISVDVLNPNRVTVDYTVSRKDVAKKLTLKGGEKGTVSFPGIDGSEQPILVKGDDRSQAEVAAKLDCGQPTTNPPPTTETPVPQGRSDSGLANTGASVGWLSALGAVAVIFGGALFMIGRRRVRRST